MEKSDKFVLSKDKDGNPCDSGLSRRDFLKGAAAGAIGIATAGVLGACAPVADTPVIAETTPPPAPPAATPTPGANAFASPYEVINTDLIIVGAGYGAMSAAFEAVAKGKTITIIEKATYRHGGAAGFNWDAIATWVPDKQFYKDETFLHHVVNQELFYKAEQDDPNMDQALMLLNRGHVLPDRLEDGSIRWYADFPFMRAVEGVFPRNDMDALMGSPLVTIVDRTMVTDLLINDKKCLGVIGLYLPTGDVRVFRAKATIVATGPATWFYGWNTVSANSIGTPDNTGDVEMAAYRHGAGIGDSEYAAYDFATTYPAGLAYGWNTMLNPDANEYGAFADKNGKQLITEESGIDLQRILHDRVYFNTELAKLMLAGAATDDGGLVANLSDVHLRHAMANNLQVFEDFGIDPYKEQLPIHDEIYERGGTPVIDDKMMSEDIEGLFCVRGAGVNGAGGGSCLILNARFGSYALRSALNYIDDAKPLTQVSWTPVEEELARLHDIRTREVNGGLRPFEIRHRIQKACGSCMGILRETPKLEACKIELERIRTEDMPKMVVSNKTQTYNTEWKEAIENYNLLDAAELSVIATLERTESRGTYLRPDFPDVDDTNWKCMLVAKRENEAPIFTKKQMPEHAW